MAKRLFFAAMTCCMVICSVTLVACSDDDDSGSGTSGGGEVTTKVYQDGVEGVMNYFYETRSNGERVLLKGVALDKKNPSELTMPVKSDTVAYQQFRAMIYSVDETFITEHVDGSITASLTDTLGNAKGTAEFVLVGEGGVVATVTFSEGLIEGVSKVDFILESAWPTNFDYDWWKARQIHFYGDTIQAQVPVVKTTTLGNGSVRYLSSETKTVNMICVTHPALCWPACYVYVGSNTFSISYNYKVNSHLNWPIVLRFLPSKDEMDQLAMELGIHDYYQTKEKAKENYEVFKSLMMKNGSHNLDGQYYWTSTDDGMNFTTYSLIVRLSDGYDISSSEIDLELGDIINADSYPYIILMRLKYDEEWDGTF